jgi:O-succinylhomoserine sulfhydrylase
MHFKINAFHEAQIPWRFPNRVPCESCSTNLATDQGRENAFKVMNAMRTVSLCTNLGDVKTLVAHPASTSHGRLTEAQRQVAGIQQSLIRVAVGLEHLDDLKADFLRGFSAL